MTSPEQVVRDFCAAWERLDVEELLGWFTPDAVYHNMPVDAATGHDGIRAVMDMFVPTSTAIRFEILHLAAQGNVVHTERIDHFTMTDGRRVALPVAGVFEVTDDGKIAAWRDYFDLNQFLTGGT
jgi:limonene-1,2-epoxide hydrolase